jgi:hypothetical protein
MTCMRNSYCTMFGREVCTSMSRKEYNNEGLFRKLPLMICRGYSSNVDPTPFLIPLKMKSCWKLIVPVVVTPATQPTWQGRIPEGHMDGSSFDTALS